MNISIILGILGIIATILIGIVGFIFAKKKHYQGEITLLTEECISLFNDIVKNMPELQVFFMEQPVKENLVLFKGYFLNTGSKDITEQMVVNNLEITIPKGSKWINPKVVDSSDNVIANIKIKDDTSIIFDLGLFRCNEFIKFECLAEMLINDKNKSPSKFLEKNIEIKQRIADTGRTKQQDMPTVTQKKHPWHYCVAIAIPLVLTIIIHFEGIPVSTNYLIQDGNGKEIEITVDRNAFGKFVLKQINGDYKKVCNPEDFFKLQPIKILQSTSFEEKYRHYIIWGLFWLPALIILIVGCRIFYRNKKIGLLLTSQSTGSLVPRDR